MQTLDYLRIIVKKIHTTVFATVDSQGRPVTCAIDMMDYEGGRYPLLHGGIGAGPGKGDRPGYAALFEKNPYMAKIYPHPSSRSALTVFKIFEGQGEWFDLSKLPIDRASFSFGGAQARQMGYFVNGQCIGCKLCYSKCPQKCIDITRKPVVIEQEHCLHCGNCFEICPARAVERREQI